MPQVDAFMRELRNLEDGKLLHARLGKEHGATIPYLSLDHSILYGETIPHYIGFSWSGGENMPFGALPLDHSIQAGETIAPYYIHIFIGWETWLFGRLVRWSLVF